MNGQQKILSIWAYTQIDVVDNTEGIIGYLQDDGRWLPLVGADLARVHSLLPYAQAIADRTQQPVTLAHFSVRTDEVTLSPR